MNYEEDVSDRTREKLRCPECNWTISIVQSACLNSKCSMHDKKEVARIEYFVEHGHWPKETKGN